MALEILPSDDTRMRILKAVFHAMQATDIPRITVEEVTRYAGISRSTFYRYFDSVDAVVKDFEDYLLRVMRDINDSALKVRFTAAELEPTASMITRMETLYNYRDEVIALNGPNGDPQFPHKVTSFMYDYLRERIRTVPGDKRYRDMYLMFVIHGHNAFVEYWLEHRTDVQPRIAAAMLCRLYYSPFFLDEQNVSMHPKPLEFDD